MGGITLQLEPAMRRVLLALGACALALTVTGTASAGWYRGCYPRPVVVVPQPCAPAPVVVQAPPVCSPVVCSPVRPVNVPHHRPFHYLRRHCR
jgi:hypothetical protein